MSTFGVDSFHINIGNGDCSFHVLAEYPAKVGHRCVLIDGGSAMQPIDVGTGTQGRNPLREMMDYLAARYTWPDSSSRFKIDTVVLSHWDEDHYGNLLDTIKRDAIQYGANIPYFKYDGNGNPLTYFYCPNWTVGTRLNPSPPNYLRINNDGSVSINKLFIGVKKTTQFDWVPFCILRTCDDNVSGSSWNSVLGVDFLHNTQCRVDIDTVADLDTLATNNKPPRPDWPSMYCIGVRQRTPGPPTFTVIEENPTITNRVSIVCIIYWTNSKRISHYLAGDADQVTEHNVMGWITQSGHSPLITSVKLSHHGSRSSTPLNMLAISSPRNVVLSIPSARHIHPSLEIVWHLRLWSLASNSNPAVLGTKYPHFFAVEMGLDGRSSYKKSARINLKCLENKDDSEYVEYWDYTGTLLEKINRSRKQAQAPEYVSILDQYWEERPTQSSSALKPWALDYLVCLWRETCHPGPKSHPSVGAGFVFPTRASITESNQVHAVLIANRNDASDGTVYHKYYLHDDLFEFRREARGSIFPTQVAVTGPNGVVSVRYIHQPNFASGPSRSLTTALAGAKAKGKDKGKAKGKKKGLMVPAANPDDVKYFYLSEAAVVPGTYSDPPPSDPNEDSDAEEQDDDSELAVAGTGVRAGSLPVRLARPASPPPPLPASHPLPRGATSRKETAPSRGAVGALDGYYYFAHTVSGSAIQSAGVASTQYAILDAGTPLNAFVSTLHSANLSVVGSTPPSPGETRALLATDEFGLCMSETLSLLLPGISVFFGPAGTPGSFALATPAPSMSTPGSSGAPPLLFNTDAVADAFGLSPADAPPLGILSATKVMIFGLAGGGDASLGPITATLGQLVAFAGIEYLVESPAILALQAIKLTVPPVTKGRRNAIWLEPLRGYRTTTRLEMDLDSGSVSALNGYLHALAGIQVTSASVVARRTSTCSPATTADGQVGMRASFDGSITFVAKVQVGTENPILFDAGIEIHPAQTKVVLLLRSGRVDVVQPVFKVLAPLLGLSGDNFPFSAWLGRTAGSASFPHIYLRRIGIVLDSAPDSRGVSATAQTPGISSVQIDLEARTHFADGVFAIFLLTYTWNKSDGPSNMLRAGLWASPTAASGPTQMTASTTAGTSTSTSIDANALLPDYEAYLDLGSPVTLDPGEAWPSYLDLSKMGGFDGLPKEIPHHVTEATLTVGSLGIAFSGSIMADEPVGPAIPVISLNELALSVSYKFGQKDSLGGSLMMRAMLRPAPGARNAIPAMILGEVSYDAGLWKLTALAQNIYGSTLYQLFDPDIGSGIGEILDNIGITSLGIEYHYAARGGATSFSVDGDLVIGSLGLTLDFTHDPTQWRFEAHLDVSRTELGKATLSDVLAYLFGDTVTSEMPAFIRDIPVIPPRDEKAVGFDMAALPAPGGSPGTGSTKERPLLFTAWLSFLDMTFQGVQYQGVTPEGAGGSVGSNRPRPRRIFELVVNSLPAVDIPLVGNVTQPFDEMLLLYVHPEQGDTAESGLTFAEARAINDELRLVGRRQLPYRATKKFADEDVVLTIGAHFILVLKGPAGQSTVALDYVFYVPTLTPRKPSSGFVFTGAGAGGSETAVTAPPGTGPGPAKAPYEKRIGPLSIRNMGFQFTPGEKPVLSIIMDASIAVGPIALDLLGFGLDLSFDKGVTLFQLPTPCPRIAGLGVAFDRPPVVIAGMFEHRYEDLPVKRDWYQGAATLSFQPYLFTAAGYYGTTTTASSETFISAFVYFILHGPLVELEFAEINGVMGGFGYNTFLQLPNPTNVLDFPFLRNPDSTDPNQELAALVGGAWFFPQNGAFWLAAGLSVKALQMLQVRLVLVVEWNPNVQLGLYGVATADMPAGNQESLKMLHAELGVTATFDFGTDALRIEGQLAPSSYVWDPFCHLRGGFAYYQWFRGAEPDGAAGPIPAGDFVFTVGGYHRNFQPPAQYPSNVPRLGISWSFDSAISITGEAYFAITPNVAMAGGRLDASLSLGPLSAWFDAWADLLINYKPFHFTAVGGVSVGVRFTLDLWICTIHISVEIGATLYLAGPALHGTVHVDFWVFGFDIDFGDDSGGPAGKLGLEQFYDLALQADLSKAVAAGASTGTGDDRDDPPSASPPPHVYSCNEGLVPTGSTESTPNKDDEPWRVRGAVFRFTVGCKFAIDSADVVTAQTDPHAPPIPPLHIPGNGQPIYARPMHCTKRLDSTLTVTITPVDSPTKGPLLTGQDHGDAPPPVPVWDNGVPVVKPVPKAVWGLYSAADDPNDPNNPDPNHNSNLLQPTNTSGDPSSPTATLVPLTMGITLSSPLPRIATDCIPAFAYETFFVRPVGDPVAFPAPKASNAAWYPRALPLAHGTTTSTTGTSTSTSDVGGSDEWEYVRSRWSGTPGLGSGAAEAAVKTWAALSFATGWQVDTRPGDISGKAPEKMLEEGTFQTLFLEAPRVCAFPGRGA